MPAPRVLALERELLPSLPSHAAHPQNVMPNYVGINLHQVDGDN